MANKERKRKKVAEDIHPSLRGLKEEGEGYECPNRHFPKALLIFRKRKSEKIINNNKRKSITKV